MISWDLCATVIAFGVWGLRDTPLTSDGDKNLRAPRPSPVLRAKQLEGNTSQASLHLPNIQTCGARCRLEHRRRPPSLHDATRSLVQAGEDLNQTSTIRALSVSLGHRPVPGLRSRGLECRQRRASVANLDPDVSHHTSQVGFCVVSANQTIGTAEDAKRDLLHEVINILLVSHAPSRNLVHEAQSRDQEKVHHGPLGRWAAGPLPIGDRIIVFSHLALRQEYAAGQSNGPGMSRESLPRWTTPLRTNRGVDLKGTETSSVPDHPEPTKEQSSPPLVLVN